MTKNKRPDFLIVGMERSGTHWVAALLNNHPDAACFPSLPFELGLGKNKIGEVHFFDTLASLNPDLNQEFSRPFDDFLTKYNKVFADIVPYKNKTVREELYKMLVECYSQYCDKQRGNKKIVGEGTPAYVFYLDFIDSFYPGIKKMCIIRDPKDKIVSWSFNQIRKGRKTEKTVSEGFAFDYLEKIKKEYQALIYYDGDIHCLTYESLSNNTAKVAEEMLGYLGMEESDRIISRMIGEASFKKQTLRDSGSKTREKGQEDIMSGLRKGIVGDWKKYISKELADKIDDLVSGLREEVFIKYDVKNYE